MGRKKTLDDFDYDGGEQGKEPQIIAKVSLADFIVYAKIEAFSHGFKPADELDPGSEGFDDAKLREYFKAYVCSLGDPLALYIDALTDMGFKMVTSLATNKPTIFVVPRI